MSSKEINNPIFLLGVGRCGSTFQQITISRLPGIWIWGEHDGILDGFLTACKSTKNSEQLKRYVFSREIDYIQKIESSDLSKDVSLLAWANCFNLDSVISIEKTIFNKLFAERLPIGKTRWGFKEIRYGPKNQVPERLLEIFPESKIIHTIRNPFPTVESSIFSWKKEDLKEAIDNNNLGQVEELYRLFIDRWIEFTTHLINLEKTHPKNIFRSKLETFQENYTELLDFLEVTEKAPLSNSVVNGNLVNDKSDTYKEVLFSFRKKFKEKVYPLTNQLGYDIDSI